VNDLYTDLRNELLNDPDTALDNALDNELRNELNNELRNELDNELDNELYTELRKQKTRSHWFYGINVWSRVLWTWYYFIAKELQVKTKHFDNLEWLFEIANCNIGRGFYTDKYVLILRTPKTIKRNEIGIHSTEGMAIDYGRMGMYYVNGRRLPKDVFYAIKAKTYTPEQFFKTDNEEEKSACIAMMQELYGDTYVFDFFKSVMSEVDNYVDKKDSAFLEGTTNSMNVGVYTLFKGEINDEIIAYIRCYCPSTDRMFFLGVEPKYTTAKDAIASLYRVPKLLKNNIKYIQRQGERFSTVFDEQGNNLLKSGALTEQEMQNTVTINGDEYFSKMKYEY